MADTTKIIRDLAKFGEKLEAVKNKQTDDANRLEQSIIDTNDSVQRLAEEQRDRNGTLFKELRNQTAALNTTNVQLGALKAEKAAEDKLAASQELRVQRKMDWRLKLLLWVVGTIFIPPLMFLLFKWIDKAIVA